MPESEARSSSVHHASGVRLLGPFSDPQVEEAEVPQYDPQLYETDERSLLVDSYENVDRGSQSSTNYSAEEAAYTPSTNGAQYYRPCRSSSGQQNYLVGLAQENDVLQTSEHSGSFESAFQQQGNHMGATSASNLGDNSRHINPWGSPITLSPEVGPHRVDYVSRDLQDATFRTDRHSSEERHPYLQTGIPAITQMPLVSELNAVPTSSSDWQGNPLEQVTADEMEPSLVSPFNSGVFDWPNGSARNNLAGIHRSLSLDSGSPDNATSPAHNSHIGLSVSEPRRNSQSSYQGGPQYHRASAFQPQAQGIQRGTRGSLLLTQDPSVMPYGMQSLDNDEFARNPQELTKGAQADNPPPGNAKTHLFPTWKPTHKASSNIHYDERAGVSNNEGRQRPHITPRGSKRKHRSDSPSPTTPPPKTKRRKRKFTPSEKAEISEKRKIGVCKDCRIAKRRVCESLQTSLYQCYQAYCSCSARMCPLAVALPLVLSPSRAYPLPDRPLAGLRNE